MTGFVSIHWQIEPETSPRPIRHCRHCGETGPFRSSGKVRLNANGRRLDAWLIYGCVRCDETWNLPLLERAAVESVGQADLRAMQQNDPVWVGQREADLDLLGRHSGRIELSPEVTVRKLTQGALPEVWTTLDLTLSAPRPTGQRLDRLLSTELGLPRSGMAAMVRAGGLLPIPGAEKALRRPVPARIVLRFVAASLTALQRHAVATGLVAKIDQ